MSKKLVLASLALLVCVAATGAGYLAWDEIFPPPPEVSPRSFARLRVGMSEERVCEILGQPDFHMEGNFAGFTRHWDSELYTVAVDFCHDGTAYCGTCLRVGESDPILSFDREESLIDRCRGWLGL